MIDNGENIMLVNGVFMDILIIDDDPATIDLIKIQLQTTEFNLTFAYSGEEGLNLVNQNAPDLIILDILMPDMDGLETCKKLRRICQAPILILSAVDQPQMIANALDAGADDYLVKPVSSTILIAHLQNLARRIQNNTRHNPRATIKII
jgi:DNA-binding response OmpR family regulator